jgi:DNA-binding XRE family transcriptional regulator
VIGGRPPHFASEGRIRGMGGNQMSERTRDVPTLEVDKRATKIAGPAPAAEKHATSPPPRLDLSFAIWLSRQLRRQRISQRELARRGGLDHSTISRILGGARAPSWSTVQRIAGVVGFPPPNVLLGGSRRHSNPSDDRPARSQRRDES